MGINLPIPNVNSPFKFWCQKVLPLVYDDSLSYYEVLCKLTTYVNGLRDDIILLGKDVSDLNNLYNELRDLIERYYEKGVQESIDKKLDEMAQDGYFEEIIAKYVSEYMPFYFETTEEMLETNLHVGAKVRTGGYYKIDDGGACDFIITDQEDSFNLMLRNGLYAIPIINGEVRPEIFGAKGDNINIDTGAIQLALNYAAKFDRSNFKAMPDKIYLIDAPLYVEMLDSSATSTYYKYGKTFDFNGSIITSNTVLACAIRFRIWQDNEDRHYIQIKNINVDGNLEKIHTGVWFQHLSCADVVGVTANNVRRGILWSQGNESTISQIFCRRSGDLDITLANGNWVDKLEGVFEAYASSVGYNYSEHENVLDNNGFIELARTDCCGIETTVNDAFIDTAIIVDFVISYNNFGGGDMHINKLHGWNYFCGVQALSSAIVCNTSSNWYTNCIFDHYRIGVYCKYSVPVYLSQCNFTNNYVANIDVANRTAYNFYFNKLQSSRLNSSLIFCSNTRFNGDNNATKYDVFPVTEMCNLNNVKFELNNCSFYNIMRYKPCLNTSKTLTNYISDDKYTNNFDIYGTMKTITKIFPLVDSTNFSEYVGNTYNAGYTVGNSILFLNRTNCTNIAIDSDINNSASVTIAPASGSGSVMFLLNRGATEAYEIGDILIISVKYKTAANITCTPTANLDYLGGFNRGGVTKTYICENDNEWHICTFVSRLNNIGNVFTINVPENGTINLSDLRIYNLKKGVKRYYMESNEQYADRLIKRFGTEMIDVTLTANENLSFISTTFPIEFYDVYKDDYKKYKIRFDRRGLPLIYNTENISRFSPLPLYAKDNYIFIYQVATPGHKISGTGTTTAVYPSFQQIDITNNYHIDQDVQNTHYGYKIIFDAFYDNATNSYKNKYYLGQKFPERIDGEIPMLYKQLALTDERFSCDVIADKDEIIPLYHNGAQYLVYKDSDNVETMPTVFVEYTYPIEG